MIVAEFAAPLRSPVPAMAPHRQLARALWQWLALGLLLWLLFPVARAPCAWLGSGAFWLLGAPLASLSMLYRHALAAAWRGVLVPAPRRRRPMSWPVPGHRAARASVRPPLPGAYNASHLEALPGARPVRQPRRSPCNERRSVPVAGGRQR